jgi:flagellar biosynthesis GTPase FlhF
MADAGRSDQDEGAGRVINSVAKAEKKAIEAVRDFVETVNRAFPDIGEDGGPRQQIIDSAFKMTEQLVGASNELAHRVVKVGHVAATRIPGRKAAARKKTAAPKVAAKKSAAPKAAAKKTPAPKAAAKKSAAPKAAAKKTATRKIASRKVLSPAAHSVPDSAPMASNEP